MPAKRRQGGGSDECNVNVGYNFLTMFILHLFSIYFGFIEGHDFFFSCYLRCILSFSYTLFLELRTGCLPRGLSLAVLYQIFVVLKYLVDLCNSLNPT
jgi:hypothetical protein